jgi:hypothetical protein
MKTIKLLTLILLLSNASIQIAKSQEEYSREESGKVYNTQFYVELGGPGIIFSANFDKRFNSSKKNGWGYRAGLGFIPNIDSYDNSNNTVLTVPLGVNYVFGKERSSHTFETGAGVTFLSKTLYFDNSNDNQHVLGHLEFMYRLMPINGGFTWRIGFTPWITFGGNIILTAAIGIGYSF